MALPLLPRLALDRLRKALLEAPVVLLSGPRGSGKTTLARDLLSGPPRRYWTVGEDGGPGEAERAIEAAGPLTLDRLERAPRLLGRVLRGVGRETASGAFLLISSAHPGFWARMPAPPPARARMVRIGPLTRSERDGVVRRWNDLTGAPDREWPEVLAERRPESGNPLWPFAREAPDWKRLARRGGFPGVLRWRRARDRRRWFRDYAARFCDRELPRLSPVKSIPAFRSLMAAAALRVGRVSNQTALGRAVRVPQPTVRRYLGLLEAAGLLVRLAAWTERGRKRLIKSPRGYWSDTGLALHLAGRREPDLRHLRNLIFGDLVAWRDAAPRPVGLFHWRTTTDAEVDFVLDTPSGLLPIAVTTGTDISGAGRSGLRAFRREYPDRTRAGLVLHDGTRTSWVGERVLATPWWRIL